MSEGDGWLGYIKTAVWDFASRLHPMALSVEYTTRLSDVIDIVFVEEMVHTMPCGRLSSGPSSRSTSCSS